MANVNNPHGLMPIMRTLSGGAVQAFPYKKAAANSHAIYKWDPVTLLASGYLDGPAAITPGTTPYLGVVLESSAASPGVDVIQHVICSPEALFEAQDDGSSDGTYSGFQFADIGQNANLTFGTAGGGETRDNSGAQVAYSTHNTTSTLDVKLLGIFDSIDNAFGANCRIQLRFNKHLLSAGVAGV